MTDFYTVCILAVLPHLVLNEYIADVKVRTNSGWVAGKRRREHYNIGAGE